MLYCITLSMFICRFSANILYYGGTLMVTALFQYNKHCGKCICLVLHVYYIVMCDILEYRDTLWVLLY